MEIIVCTPIQLYNFCLQFDDLTHRHTDYETSSSGFANTISMGFLFPNCLSSVSYNEGREVNRKKKTKFSR